jgi:transcriptional regulator with XRE-family HTH domain
MKDTQTKERFIELRGQGLPLAAIAAEIGVSKPTLISWERDLKEQIDNRQAVELEAMYDKYCLSVRKRVDFFGNVLSRIRDELETRDLSAIPTEKLFAMYAHFDREALRALPELAFRNEAEIRVAKSRRLPRFDDTSIDAALDNVFFPSKKS